MSASGLNDSLTIDRLCPHCHAGLRADAVRCWLCGANVRADGETKAAITPLATSRPDVIAEQLGGFSLASLMMFVTLVCVVLGVTSLWPGIGIPMGVVFFVAWLRTTAATHQRAAHGLPVTSSKKIQMFLESFGVTVGLIIVTCVAGGAALFAALGAMCVATSAPSSPDMNWAFPWLLGGTVVTLVCIFALVKLVKFSRRRWRRDIGESD
jgi:hypothetical protein